MKSFSMKISDYYEFKIPKYIFLKITPSYSIRNYNSDKILNLINKLYKEMKNKVEIINKKLFFQCNAKVSYYIYMEMEKVEFYFILPESHYRLFKYQIIDTWANKIELEEVKEVPLFDKDCSKNYMTFTKDDALSLSCDKRNNALLSSIFTTLNIMDEGDKVGVFYNFYPSKKEGWKSHFDHRMKDLKEGKPTLKRGDNKLKVMGIIALNGIYTITNFAYELLESFGSDKKKQKTYKELDLDKNTLSKRNSEIISTQILCLSQSTDKYREVNNMISLCSSFDCLNNDNKLISKTLKGDFNMLDTKIKGADTIMIQPKEGQNFISLPARDILEEYKVIEHSKVKIQMPPKELLSGTIPLGILEDNYKNKFTTYMSDKKTLKNLPYCIIGANRTGKSTFLQNITQASQKNNECTIFFDFCGNCESSDDMTKHCTNVLNIDCSDFSKLQGMGYNEIKRDDEDILRHYTNVKNQAAQLISLVNSVNQADRDLKTKMNKLLRASAIVVFLSDGSFKDVFEVLTDHNKRLKYILKIKQSYKEYVDKYVRILNEIDDIKGDKVIGTKSNPAIFGIMDRIDSLQGNTYMELMFEKRTENNFNLIDEIQKAQIICFRMPESMFVTQSEKDSYCTYWLSKIWFALKLRKGYLKDEELVKVNLIIDEIYQVNHCEEFVKEILNQMPKFNCRMILSCHHINQLTIVKEELMNAGGSYVLIAGCSKQNYSALKEEMHPFEVDDLMRLKKFHSLNIIKLDDGYYSFVSKLPPPLNPHHVL